MPGAGASEQWSESPWVLLRVTKCSEIRWRWWLHWIVHFKGEEMVRIYILWWVNCTSVKLLFKKKANGEQQKSFLAQHTWQLKCIFPNYKEFIQKYKARINNPSSKWLRNNPLEGAGLAREALVCNFSWFPYWQYSYLGWSQATVNNIGVSSHCIQGHEIWMAVL